MIRVFCRLPTGSFASRTVALSGKSAATTQDFQKARLSLHFTLVGKDKAIFIGLALAWLTCVPVRTTIHAEEAARGIARTETPGERNWQAVAPGRIEPVSGEIKIAAPVAGVIREVLVKAGDKVTA